MKYLIVGLRFFAFEFVECAICADNDTGKSGVALISRFVTQRESGITEDDTAEGVRKRHSVWKFLLSRLRVVFHLESASEDGDEQVEAEVAAEEGDEEEEDKGADADAGRDGADLRGPVVARDEFEGEKQRRADVREGEDSEAHLGPVSTQRGHHEPG